MKASKFLLFIILGAVLSVIIKANVIGIDLATDSLKVAMVQPGKSIDIVTNFQSKRKTPTSIAFFKGERLYGSDANAMLGRKPESAFLRALKLVGRHEKHPVVEKLIKHERFPYKIVTNSTSGLLNIMVKDESTNVEKGYAPEEFLAMILEHVKAMTHSFSGANVKDCVITVPSSASQHEREAIYIAAELADVNILSLIEENTAAALQYTTEHNFETPRNVLYFNLGAGSLQVSVVKHSQVTMPQNKTINQLDVLGKSFDTNLGAYEFDMALLNHISEQFNENVKQKMIQKLKDSSNEEEKLKISNFDVRDYVRPMARLRNEVTKLKEVLSANSEFPIRIEQLYDNYDLNIKVSRKKFESVSEKLLSNIGGVIDQAIEASGLNISDLHSVELLGGGVRVPIIKTILDKYFSIENLVGQHLNGDEAMALGASFRAASFSTSKRTRQINVNDYLMYPINLNLKNIDDSNGEAEWSKTTDIYPAKSQLNSKKTVTISHSNDFLCNLSYNDAESAIKLPEGTDPFLGSYKISGLTDFSKEIEEKGLSDFPIKVNIYFLLDNSGIVRIQSAEALVELPEKSEAQSDETSEEEKKEEEEKKNEEEKKGEEENKGEKEEEKKDETEKKDSKKDKKGKKEKKEKKDNQLKKKLTITFNKDLQTTPKRWTAQDINEAKSHLKYLQQLDEKKAELASALNSLEEKIYKTRNFIYDNEEEFKKISTDEQREKLLNLLNELEDWLYEKDESKNYIETFTKKDAQINELKDPIIFRFTELTARVEESKKAEKTISNIQKNMKNWGEKYPQITEEEKETLLDKITKFNEWLSDMKKQQAELDPTIDPVFTSSMISPKMRGLVSYYKSLIKKPVPKKEEKKEESEANSESKKDESNAEESKSDEAEKEDKDETNLNSEESSEDKKQTDDEL